jgi:hypothetical protein
LTRAEVDLERLGALVGVGAAALPSAFWAQSLVQAAVM